MKGDPCKGLGGTCTVFSKVFNPSLRKGHSSEKQPDCRSQFQINRDQQALYLYAVIGPVLNLKSTNRAGDTENENNLSRDP